MEMELRLFTFMFSIPSMESKVREVISSPSVVTSGLLKTDWIGFFTAAMPVWQIKKRKTDKNKRAFFLSIIPSFL